MSIPSRISFAAMVAFGLLGISRAGAEAAAPKLSCPELAGAPGDYTDSQVAEFLKAANDGRTLTVNRGFTLPKGATLKRILQIEAPVYGPMVINLNGGKVDPANGSDVVVFVSHKNADGSWCQLKDVTVKNGSVFGGTRAYGLGVNGQSGDVPAASKVLGYTESAQAIAPTNITLDSMTLSSSGRTPLYLSPGTNHFTIKNSKVTGTRGAVGIYMDGESAYNQILDNVLDAKSSTSREFIAVDGSAHNTIKGNRFADMTSGGIFVYRNCGEGGAVRQQEPRFNEISGNVFVYKNYTGTKPAVWLGSRQTLTYNHYCNDDNAYPFGSGLDNHDFARENSVVGNNTTGRKNSEAIQNSDIQNIVKGNFDDFTPAAVTGTTLAGLRRNAAVYLEIGPHRRYLGFSRSMAGAAETEATVTVINLSGQRLPAGITAPPGRLPITP